MAKKTAKLTDLERIAYHESGHAVMAYLFHRRFHSITIDSSKLDESTGGLVRLVHSQKLVDSLNAGDYSREIEKHIRIILAGEVSNGIISGQEEWDLSHSDIETSFRLASFQCGCEKEVKAYIDWLLISVYNHLKLPFNWGCVCGLAKGLMQQKPLVIARPAR